MIDPVAVVQIRAAARALAKPPEILARDDVPPVHRHAPVLAVGAEGVGRRAEGYVEQELLLARPDVGAVTVDHERQIAKELHAVRPAPRRRPLRGRDPL